MTWRLASDDSGHDYCIPAHLADEFEEWVERAESNQEITGRDFTDFMLGGCPGQLTFESPVYRGQDWEEKTKESETK